MCVCVAVSGGRGCGWVGGWGGGVRVFLCGVHCSEAVPSREVVCFSVNCLVVVLS